MKRIFNAFFYSMDGLRWAATREAAFRQELAVVIAGALLAPFVAAAWWQAVLLVGALVLVLVVELLNTAIEKLCDHVRPERHEDIRVIKDMGSAACFLTQALAAATWATVVIARWW